MRWWAQLEEVGEEERHLTQTVAEGSCVLGSQVVEVVLLRWFAVANGACGGYKGLRRPVQKTHQAGRMLMVVRNWALPQKLAAVMSILKTIWSSTHRQLRSPPAIALTGEQLSAENR